MITSNSPDRRQQSGHKRALRISPGRIGRWSARRPWLALTIWGAFVAGCVAAGAATGTSILASGSVGQSARGADVMARQGLPGPSREYAYVHGGTLVSTDPAFRAAVGEVQRRITALGLRASATASADRHSVLVSVSSGRPAGPSTGTALLAPPARTPG